MKKKHYKSYLPIVSFVLISISIYILYTNNNDGHRDLGDWKDPANRSEMLEQLLGEKPVKWQVTDIPSKADIFGLSETEVIRLLGKPTSRGTDRLRYRVGNLTADPVSNAVVPQEALLVLIFENNKCVKYQVFL